MCLVFSGYVNVLFVHIKLLVTYTVCIRSLELSLYICLKTNDSAGLMEGDFSYLSQ